MEFRKKEIQVMGWVAKLPIRIKSFGNPDLKPEFSKQGIITTQTKIKDLNNVNLSKMYQFLKSNFVLCKFCYDYKATVIHHVNHNNKDNRLDNLMFVCKGCHLLRIHNMDYIKDYINGEYDILKKYHHI